MNIIYQNRYNELIENEIKYIYSIINIIPLDEILKIISRNRNKVEKLLKLEFGEIINKKLNINQKNIKIIDKDIINLYNEIINYNYDKFKIIELFWLICNKINISYGIDIYYEDIMILINALLLNNQKYNQKYFIYVKKENTYPINVAKNNSLDYFIFLFYTLFSRNQIVDIGYSYEINIIEPRKEEDVIMNNFYSVVNNLKLCELNNEF